MFVPSESVYELYDHGRQSHTLDEYCRSKNVVASQHALCEPADYLDGIAGMQLEEREKPPREFWRSAVELRKFVDPFEKQAPTRECGAELRKGGKPRKAETSVEAMLAGDPVPQIAGGTRRGPLALPVASKQRLTRRFTITGTSRIEIRNLPRFFRSLKFSDIFRAAGTERLHGVSSCKVGNVRRKFRASKLQLSCVPATLTRKRSFLPGCKGDVSADNFNANKQHIEPCRFLFATRHSNFRRPRRRIERRQNHQ